MMVLPIFLSQLLKSLHPLCELSLVDAPLATDSKGGQFLSLDHAMNGSPGQLQHVSGLLKCQQAHRVVTVFGRCFHGRNLSNGNAIALLSTSGRFLEKAGALSYARWIPPRGFGTNRSTSARKTRGATGFRSQSVGLMPGRGCTRGTGLSVQRTMGLHV